MKGIVLNKRSFCNTKNTFSLVTKSKLLGVKQDKNLLLDILNSLNIDFDSNKITVFDFVKLDKNTICVIFGRDNARQCIYINKNGYVYFRDDNRFSLKFMLYSNSLCLVDRNRLLSSLCISIDNYLNIHLK